MKINWLPLAAAVALAAGSVSASAVDFHGYFRAGTQLSTHGGEVYCLGNGGAGHKVGRLADECDTYGETSLSQEVYNKANNKFTVNTLFAYGSEEGDRDLQGNDYQGVGGNGPWAGQRLSFREMYAKYDTADGYSIWAGKRYYQRKDIHIMDFYYLNNSGHGAGIENIDVGAGNLNFAVVKFVNGGNNSDYNRNVYKVDARWNAIPVGFGTLDASLIYGFPAISGKQRDAVNDHQSNNANSGVLLTLDHSSTVGASDGSFNLMNHLVFQWGTNGFGYVGTYSNHAGDNYIPDVDINGVRLIDWGVMDFGSDIDLGYSLFWSHLDNGDDHNNGPTWTEKRSGWEYSIVVRPEYKWTEFTRTTLELGYSQKKTIFEENEYGNLVKYDNPDAYKFTIAQQFTPGKGFWSRPAIRFYASYLGGDQFGKLGPKYTGKNASGHNHQFTFGTQVEAWW